MDLLNEPAEQGIHPVFLCVIHASPHPRIPMALKRQHDMMAMFPMASMTDVIFLLLIFFMITSTFVFPTALEVNLPQSTVQTAL